ncbi:MAG: hypothetical protein IPP13_27535 [Kouleothrix sp.]|jgi:hypothetical protein|nr:hypothetical protein [Kouleothrix sp.]
MTVRLATYAPLAWSALVVAALVAWFGSHGYDDPFITYRYAENLAGGLGFVYNAGERVLSTTTPLYTLVLAGARLLGADVPLFSNALGVASLALGGLAFWWLGQAWHTPFAGLVGLVAFPLFPLLVTSLGSEVALYLALTLGGFLAYAHGRYTAVALLLGLAALVRADGVLAAVAVAAVFLIERRGPIPWRAVGIYAGLLAPWFVFAQAYFGAPFPVTLAAKRRQGLLPASELFLPGLLAQARDNYWRYPVYRPIFGLAGVGLPYAALARSRWLLPIGWSGLYIVAYTALGVTSYFWYYGPVLVGFVALAGLGAEWLARLVQRALGRLVAGWLLALLLAALLLRGEYAGLQFLRDHPDTRQLPYHAVGTWLREHTPPGARVGTLEVGIIGYYAQRPMIDFAGLLQPEVALQLTPSSGYDDAAVWAFEHYRPDFLVLQNGALPRLQTEVAPAYGCRPVHTISAAAYPLLIAIFDCRV